MHSCGTKLPDNNFGCYINVNLTCPADVEQPYYKNDFPVVCNYCGTTEFSVERKNECDQYLLSYSSVKASCSEDCGPVIFSYPRKVKLTSIEKIKK